MTEAVSQPRAMWEAVGDAVAAHALMLYDIDVLDNARAGSVLTALDGVRLGDPPSGGPTALVAAFDERLDALTAARAPGAGALGRGRADTAATALRIVLRASLLELFEAAGRMRLALLDLADAHVFTLMPAYGEGRPLQPTTFAHYLGGAIGPLGRATARLRTGYTEVNRSPMGAVALASTSLPIDRETVARLLGFEGPLVSTFDAVSAVDHLSAALDPVAAMADAVGRFLADLQTWLRAEPGSLAIEGDWLGEPDPSVPQFRPATGIERLVAVARAAAADANVATSLATEIPYGPTGATIDPMSERMLAVLSSVRALVDETASLVAGGVQINRSHFASRAGRDHVTTSELAALLVEQEGLDPAAARALTAAVVREAMGHGLEASAITPQTIDAAALTTIGRELGIEIERLGAYLAPRRFLERRTALGSPSPGATRDWLELERTRALADERWRDEAAGRLRQAREDLERSATAVIENME